MLNIAISPEVVTIIMFGGLLIGVLAGCNLAMAIGGVGFIAGYLLFGPGAFELMYNCIYSTVTSYSLMAVPLFIFMGNMLGYSGISEKAYNVLYIFFGKKIRGNLAIVSVLFGTIIAACVGVIAASVTMLTIVALPEMIKKGYDKSLATGSICAGGSLGILIPPSIMLVVYGPAAGISVGKLFMAAIVPGLLLSGLYILYIFVRCHLQPGLAPVEPDLDKEENISFAKKMSMLFYNLTPVFLLISSVLGVIYLGLAAPTEAAAVGAVFATILSIICRRFNWKVLKEVSLDTLNLTGMILLIACCSKIFVSVFLSAGGGGVVENFILSVSSAGAGGRWMAFALIMLICFILGMFIDWVGIIFLMVPILVPIISKLGFDPLWFAMMIIVNLQMSFLTPPFAYSIFYLKGAVSPELGIQTGDIIHGVIPYVFIIMIAIVLMIVFPQIVLWLPSTM